MRVIARGTLRDFWERHPDAERPLRVWYDEVRKAQWTGPADIRRHYAHASIIGSDRVVFNVGGNKYRLITVVHYQRQTVYIRFIGTHADYDKINAATV